jgi:glycosyltransferase involved in cell wall biosynthesis
LETSWIVDVLIPAYNEEKSIAKVINDIPKEWVREIVVVNNNSTDNTETVAKSAGATVLKDVRQGYGSACLFGINYLKNKTSPPDILVFLDGDYSDYPEQMIRLIQSITEDGLDMVIGSRTKGNRENGALLPQQVYGNWLATTLLRWFYGAKFSDLGPFRAIRFKELLALDMQDTNYGWTVEMQIKAVKKGLHCGEVPVDYRKRIGQSKIAGTVKGTILAGYKIIRTLFKYR